MWPQMPNYDNPIVAIYYHTAISKLFNFQLLSSEKSTLHTGNFPMKYQQIQNVADARKITFHVNDVEFANVSEKKGLMGLKIEGTKVNGGMFKKDTR